MNGDALEEQIVALLREDGRLSNREVARRLNTSEGTVRQRLKKLQDSGALRIGAVIDPAHLDLNSAAYVRLRVAPHALAAVTTALAALEEVVFVASAVGAFNVILTVVTRDQAALTALLNAQIERITGVLMVDVRPVVGIYKQDYHVVRIPPRAERKGDQPRHKRKGATEDI